VDLFFCCQTQDFLSGEKHDTSREDSTSSRRHCLVWRILH